MTERPYVGMTLRELRALLAEIPRTMDDHVVVVAHDEEGNGFNTLADIEVGWYRNQDERSFRGTSPGEGETWTAAEVRITEEYQHDEDDPDEWIPVDEHDHRAICLWP